MGILQNHRRNVTAKMNLKKLLGSHGSTHLVKHRITAPFDVGSLIVKKEEDCIFCGFVIKVLVGEATGEMHIHFKLKEKGKAFTPVKVDDAVEQQSGAPTNPNQSSSMFRELSIDMSTIPKEVTFMSPAGKHRGSD
mgnify:CR=1 FL=1